VQVVFDTYLWWNVSPNEQGFDVFVHYNKNCIHMIVLSFRRFVIYLGFCRHIMSSCQCVPPMPQIIIVLKFLYQFGILEIFIRRKPWLVDMAILHTFKDKSWKYKQNPMKCFLVHGNCTSFKNVIKMNHADFQNSWCSHVFWCVWCT